MKKKVNEFYETKNWKLFEKAKNHLVSMAFEGGSEIVETFAIISFGKWTQQNVNQDKLQ